MKISVNPNFTKYLLPMHPVVFISTVSKKREHNAGAYATLSDISYNPAIVIFASAKTQHEVYGTNEKPIRHKQDTYLNILETKCFVVNVPGRNLINKLSVLGYPFPAAWTKSKWQA